MLYSFAGDLILQDLEKYSDDPFKEILQVLKDTKVVVNLESPFVDEDCDIPLKSKVTLCQDESAIRYLKQLNPSLISLSNNHINDYSNKSIELTKNILDKNDLAYFGAGDKTDDSHIFINDEEKIIFIAYTTRETDLTGGYLFADDYINGPKNINFEEIKSLRQKYQEHKIVLYLHWGVEYIPLPMPSQRELAYKLVDNGVDLIVGHHAHIIQPYEVYKDKYIFYSLGNFLFADIEFFLNGQKQQMKQEKFMKEGLICQFDIQNNELKKLIRIQRKDDCQLSIMDEYNDTLKLSNGILYKLQYKYHSLSYRLENAKPIGKKLIKKIIKYIVNNLSDYWYAKIRFIRFHGYIPNFKNPRSFSEKINYIKLYKINELREKIVDRIWVRDYVKQKAQECKLIENLWVGKEFTKEVWNNLPQEFVIKGNHGSGMVKVVNKKENSFLEILDLTKIWMKTDYAKLGREWFYNKVEPLIIVEEKLKFNDDIPPDFKFFCFNGKVEIVQVDTERFIKHKRDMYDRDFNILDVKYIFERGQKIEKPLRYDQAVKIAEKLSQDFDFIRVDLYLLDDAVYFGELTNVPGNGVENFEPKSFDFELGKKLVLND